MRRKSPLDRLFLFVLRLFPAEFRADFGRQMTDDLREQQQDAAGDPHACRRLWSFTAPNLLRQAIVEHADALLRDIRFAARSLGTRRTSTLVAVASLSVGVGLNAAVFSVARDVIWEPLPLPESERLVHVATASREGRQMGLSSSTYQALQAEHEVFEQVSAAGSYIGLTIESADGPTKVMCLGTAEGFFEVFRAAPALGRLFVDADFQPSRAYWSQTPALRAPPEPRAVVLGHELWRRLLHGDSNVISHPLRVREFVSEIEVVGVASPEMSSLRGVSPAECWWPESINPEARRANLWAVGRLADTVSPARAESRLSALEIQRDSTPGDQTDLRLTVTPLLERLVGRVRPQLSFLVGASLCVLLVTAVNVANLLLAVASGRRHELATRMALGATRQRLVRQAVAEGLVLAVLASTAGSLLTYVSLPALLAMAPPEVPRIDRVRLEWSTLAVLIGAATFIGIACGVLATLSSRNPSQGPSLRAGTTQPPQLLRLRQTLAAGQIAVALMLAVGATLMVRTLAQLQAIELGFDPDRVVYTELPVELSGADYAAITRVHEFHANVIARVKALPGVEAAGIGIGPLGGGMFLGGLVVPGDAPREIERVRVDAVSPGYFEALGARLIAGRFFYDRDATLQPEPVVINRTAAREFWGNDNPLGKILAFNEKLDVQVVGVVEDLRGGNLEDEQGATLYQFHTRSRNFIAGAMLVRVSRDPDALTPAIRGIVRGLGSDEAIQATTPLQSRIDRSLAPRRFVLRLTGLFSTLALILVAIGIYGLLVESVNQRVPEIGVRMALGAESTDVVLLILRQVAIVAGIGLLFGLTGALLVRDVMSSLTYGVTTSDPMAYLIATLLLIAATLAASLAPAHRAVNLDPVAALRAE